MRVDDVRQVLSDAVSVACVGDDGTVSGLKLRGGARAVATDPQGPGAVLGDDGYLVVADQMHITGMQMTLYMRVRFAGGGWEGPLLAGADPADAPGALLEVSDGRLTYTWRTTPLRQRVTHDWWESVGKQHAGADLRDGVLRLGAPIGGEADVWHEVIVRFSGPNLELLWDGVLVDEEWPHGPIEGLRGPLMVGAACVDGRPVPGLRATVQCVAFWDRALSDGETACLCGGPERVARRELEILGPPRETMQYWKPRGHNVFAGDCIPFWHDGVFHLFYLFDRRHHQSKWSLGAHQYSHATTTDLVHWEHHPMAVPIVEQWECSMGTGDVIFHDGRFHVFYTDCGGRCAFSDKQHEGDWVFVATSTDGVHFHKDLVPLVPGGDCEVFQDPQTGLFSMLRSGVDRLVSSDLRHWEHVPGEFLTLGEGITHECPNHFEWNGWFYYILGRAGLWRSRSAVGPWEEIPPNVYDGLMVPKVAAFAGNRRILAGFLPAPEWGGNIALRELWQDDEGLLYTKFAPELIPDSGEPALVGVESVSGEVGGDGKRGVVTPTDGLGIAALTGVPADARVTLRITPGEGVRCYGLCLRGRGQYEAGCELRFQPARCRAQFGSPFEGGLAPEATDHWASGLNFAIGDVDGLDGPITVDVVMQGSVIDVCIDGRRTMITRRRNDLEGDRLFVFSEGGEVRFDEVVVRPLLEGEAG